MYEPNDLLGNVVDILGNAYTTHFFVCSLEYSDLISALKAYQKAEDKGLQTPDLHFNRATVFYRICIFPTV